MDINFELYKIFYYAAKHQSFSEAADKLFISQSAVSQAIKNLESKLGEQLFFRKKRKISLTREGELLFKHIEQAYNFIRSAESKFSEMKNLDAGEVRVGVSDTVCKYFLIPYLEKFNNNYPKIKIQVINRTSSQILELLNHGLVDFGIATLPVDDKNIEVKNFISVEDIFVACHKFSELKDRTVTLRELSEYPLLMLEKGSTTRRNIEEFLIKKGIDIAPEIELEDIDLLVEFAKIGLGVSCVLRESALEDIQHNQLFEIHTEYKLPLRKLGICTVKNVPLSRAASIMIDNLINK
ncbi:LysR family transcriptional regulator [Petroclostridium sp. X23]|uniref:LysR family transcriptional regulator n=1 Tax=Petroclostridium sp. X23 TaxID=3045146 RepID=UPI0024ACB365|nr:LysR family transcriptional regulator [Petroclostridium sp. X23]WHH60556.1 LysR family transcriptional regulator [Petroclostridium sp. X23]